MSTPTLDAATLARLLTTGHTSPAEYHPTYGRVLSPGFRLDEGTPTDGAVRVEYVMPEADLSDPDRQSTDDRHRERARMLGAYRGLLELEGWKVTARTGGFTNKPFLIVEHPDPPRPERAIMTTAPDLTTVLLVSPGDQWAPNLPLPLPPTAQLLLTASSCELALIGPTADPDSDSEEVFHQGTAEFGLVTVPGALMLAVCILHPQIGNFQTEAVFQASAQEAGCGLPAALPDGDGYMVLKMFLVDSDTGVIVGIRVITLDPAMTRGLRAALAEQRANPHVNQAQIDEALDRIYDRYGDATAIIRQRATTVCRSEHVAPGTPPGPVGQN